jgi:hypothetical protein
LAPLDRLCHYGRTPSSTLGTAVSPNGEEACVHAWGWWSLAPDLIPFDFDLITRNAWLPLLVVAAFVLLVLWIAARSGATEARIELRSLKVVLTWPRTARPRRRRRRPRRRRP